MKKYIAEFIATFILIFCAAGSATVNEITNGSVSLVGCALVSGLIVMALIYAVGDISGAHINPAVTIAFALNKNMQWKFVLPYITSQLLGGVAAGFLLKFLFPLSATVGATLPISGELQSLILEIITSFILMFVILRVATGSKETGMFAGIAIGFVIIANIILAGPVSGGSMNPARSLGPAVANNYYEHLWIYFAGPVIGTTCFFIFNFKVIKQEAEFIIKFFKGFPVNTITTSGAIYRALYKAGIF